MKKSETYTAKKLNEAKIQETKKITYKSNIIFKLFNLNNEEKEKIKEKSKGDLTGTGTKINMIADFSLETMQERRWGNIYNVLKVKKRSIRILYPVKISFNTFLYP